MSSLRDFQMGLGMPQGLAVEPMVVDDAEAVGELMAEKLGYENPVEARGPVPPDRLWPQSAHPQTMRPVDGDDDMGEGPESMQHEMTEPDDATMREMMIDKMVADDESSREYQEKNKS